MARSSAFFSSSYFLISSARCCFNYFARFLLIVFGVKGRSISTYCTGTKGVGAAGVGIKDGGSSRSGSSSKGHTRCNLMIIFARGGMRS